MPEPIGLDVLRPPHRFFVWVLGRFVLWWGIFTIQMFCINC